MEFATYSLQTGVLAPQLETISGPRSGIVSLTIAYPGVG
jgi:hypothetical protein